MNSSLVTFTDWKGCVDKKFQQVNLQSSRSTDGKQIRSRLEMNSMKYELNTNLKTRLGRYDWHRNESQCNRLTFTASFLINITTSAWFSSTFYTYYLKKCKHSLAKVEHLLPSCPSSPHINNSTRHLTMWEYSCNGYGNIFHLFGNSTTYLSVEIKHRWCSFIYGFNLL